MKPQEMLWKITNEANKLNSERIKEEEAMIEKANQYYLRKAQITMDDSIVNLRSADLREAEIKLIMELEPITREYGEAKLRYNRAFKKYELFQDMSNNLRALTYAQYGEFKNDEKTDGTKME